MKQPAVYIMASERNGTLYIGVTSDLVARTWQHREHVVDGLTKRYDIGMLVWYELHGTMETAILREKQINKVEPSVEVALDTRIEPALAGFMGFDNRIDCQHGFPPSRE